MTDIPKVVATAPERIFLHVSANPADRDAEFPRHYGKEITWDVKSQCEDGTDVCYMRAELAAFWPWRRWTPGDVIPHDWVLADISSAMGESYIWPRSDQIGTRNVPCIQRYCVPTQPVTL